MPGGLRCTADSVRHHRLALLALAASYTQVQVKALCLVQVLPELQQWPWQAPSTPHMPMPPQGAPTCSRQLPCPAAAPSRPPAAGLCLVFGGGRAARSTWLGGGLLLIATKDVEPAGAGGGLVRSSLAGGVLP